MENIFIVQLNNTRATVIFDLNLQFTIQNKFYGSYEHPFISNTSHQTQDEYLNIALVLPFFCADFWTFKKIPFWIELETVLSSLSVSHTSDKSSINFYFHIQYWSVFLDILFISTLTVHLHSEFYSYRILHIDLSLKGTFCTPLLPRAPSRCNNNRSHI